MSAATATPECQGPPAPLAVRFIPLAYKVGQRMATGDLTTEDAAQVALCELVRRLGPDATETRLSLKRLFQNAIRDHLRTRGSGVVFRKRSYGRHSGITFDTVAIKPPRADRDDAPGWAIPDGGDQYRALELRDEVEHLLASLPPREAHALRAYYGIGRLPALHHEIGRELGVGESRSYQIIAAAKHRLRAEAVA